MAELMFYKQPVPLNREQHKKLRFRSVRDYGFSAGHNSVPIVGLEFFEASRNMTVLFSKVSEDQFFPIVLLSLRNAGHDMVAADGTWTGSYIPSFIRRYPFALTTEGTVCFDEGSNAFSETEGDPLFDETGKNTELLDHVIRFLNQFDAELKRTREFCDYLKAHDLLKPFNAEIGRDSGSPIRLEGMFTVDEKRFSELKGEELEEWFRKGWVGWTYAHLHSIGALGTLSRGIAEAAARDGAETPAPGQTQVEGGAGS